jgi:hypothetical protein
MDKACSTHGRVEECMQGFGEKKKEENHLDVGRLVILKWFLEK